MMKKAKLNTLLALFVFSCMFAAGAVNAESMGFTAASLQSEDSSGC